jgi:hypothetical protein
MVHDLVKEAFFSAPSRTSSLSWQRAKSRSMGSSSALGMEMR